MVYYIIQMCQHEPFLLDKRIFLVNHNDTLPADAMALWVAWPWTTKEMIRIHKQAGLGFTK